MTIDGRQEVRRQYDALPRSCGGLMAEQVKGGAGQDFRR